MQEVAVAEHAAPPLFLQQGIYYTSMQSEPHVQNLEAVIERAQDSRRMIASSWRKQLEHLEQGIQHARYAVGRLVNRGPLSACRVVWRWGVFGSGTTQSLPHCGFFPKFIAGIPDAMLSPADPGV